MANRILTSSTYHDEIRGRLGVDSGTLADTDIDAPSVLPVAEARVISRVPDYASLKNDDQSFVYAAAVTMAAAVLAPSMASRIKQSEGDSDYKYTNASVDWRKRAQDLEDEAYSLIDYISTQPVVELPQIGVAGPTRVQQNEYSGTVTPWDADFGLYGTNVE